jgi:hypothetical protein
LNKSNKEEPRLLPNSKEAHRLLYPREEAAWMLGISPRSLDYLIAGKLLFIRKIGGRVLVPYIELVKFARSDHFEPISRAA